MGYPVVFDLSGKSVVVIGGGEVATRRVGGLISAGARVCVVAPELSEDLGELADRRDIAWKARPYRSGDLEGAALVLAATDSEAVNAEVAAASRQAKIPVNVADSATAGDFSIPAVADLGSIRLAIDTLGAGPAISAALRRHIEREISPGWALAAEIAVTLRPYIAERSSPDERREFWRAFAAELPAATMGSTDQIQAWIIELGRRVGIDLSAFELPAAD